MITHIASSLEYRYKTIALVLIFKNDNSDFELVKRMNALSEQTLLNEKMLEQFEADGMRPAHQARSRTLVIRLFNEGLSLLREVDFDGLSIDALCARSDSTIGAFYSRFENKEAFINALQRLVVATARRNVIAGYESQIAPNDTIAHLLSWIVRGSIVWYRRYDGLIRASLRRAHNESTAWTPIRELGELQVTYAVPRILDLLPSAQDAKAEERARFAFQMLFGTLNNIVLINPGPFTIHHPQTATMLARAMTEFIET
jgi:AcrR family transcriptional regulator